MNVTNNNVYLGKSFEKLLYGMREANEIAKPQTPEAFAQAIAFYNSVVKRHVVECTDIPSRELFPNQKENT